MDIVRWVKRNPVGALIGAAVIVGGGYLFLRPAKASASNPVPATQFVPNHIYKLTRTMASPADAQANAQAGASGLFVGGNFTPQSVNVSGSTIIVIGTYTGAQTIDIATSGLNPSVSVLDMGLPGG